MKNADELVKAKIHPTSVISGYRIACKEAIKYLEEHLALSTDTDLGVNDTTIADALNNQILLNCIKTTISSKLIGGAESSDFFAKMVLEAALSTRFLRSKRKEKETKSTVVDGGDKGTSKDVKDNTKSPPKKKVTSDAGPYVYPVKAIRILKSIGKSAAESFLITNGYALNCSLSHQAMPKQIKRSAAGPGNGVKVACLDFSLQKIKMKLGVSILVNDPDKLEAIRDRESAMAKERVDKIIQAGAKLILTTGGIDEFTSKYLSQVGIMGVRRVLKADIKRIAKACGANLVLSMASAGNVSDGLAITDKDGEETFDAGQLGEVDEVVIERIADDEVILIKGFCPPVKAVADAEAAGQSGPSPAACIILRGPNEYFLDEMERSIHDALCSIKRVLESRSLVPGGGAVEAALSVYLESFATTISSREQLAIAEFAKSLLVIPKTLAINASVSGVDATDIVAKLRAYHNSSQTKAEHALLRFVGLDLSPTTDAISTGDPNFSGIRDNVRAGVLEPAISKVKALKFATEAAITILRIDDLIKLQNMKPDPSEYDRCGGGDY